MSFLIKFAVTGLLLYFALLVFLYFYQRNLMYFPDTSKPDLKLVDVEGFRSVETQTDDGLVLTSWYKPPETNKKPVIVMFHGNAGHYGHRAEAMKPYIENGYGVFLNGYRGYGGNPGNPSEQGFYQDARAALNKLVNEFKINPEQIVLYGESIGSGVAVQMAVEYPEAGALILQSPYSSTLSLAQKRYFFMPVSLLMKDKFLSIDKISSVKAPVFILHGNQDSIIPIVEGRTLYQSARNPKKMTVFEGYGHNNLPFRDVAEQVVNFLNEFCCAAK